MCKQLHMFNVCRHHQTNNIDFDNVNPKVQFLHDLMKTNFYGTTSFFDKVQLKAVPD